MKIRLIESYRAFVSGRIIPAGVWYDAEPTHKNDIVPGGYFITDEAHAFEVIPADLVDVMYAPGELREKFSAIEAAADRLQDNVVQLRSANEHLKKEIHNLREGNKVDLPRKVVDALEYLMLTYSRRNVLALILEGRLPGVRLDYDDKRDKVIGVLRDWEFEDIMIALVNGYTVEESAEDKIKERFLHRLRKSDLLSEFDANSLADALVYEVREVLAEHQENEN